MPFFVPLHPINFILVCIVKICHDTLRMQSEAVFVLSECFVCSEIMVFHCSTPKHRREFFKSDNTASITCQTCSALFRGHQMVMSDDRSTLFTSIQFTTISLIKPGGLMLLNFAQGINKATVSLDQRNAFVYSLYLQFLHRLGKVATLC